MSSEQSNNNLSQNSNSLKGNQSGSRSFLDLAKKDEEKGRIGGNNKNV
jgi:hypothetical protein